MVTVYSAIAVWQEDSNMPHDGIGRFGHLARGQPASGGGQVKGLTDSHSNLGTAKYIEMFELLSAGNGDRKYRCASVQGNVSCSR
ncbi:MAG: hypothetical protein ACOC6S_02550 [Chloroflexota bacterium]